MLKRAAERLTQVADKMREKTNSKTGVKNSGGANNLMQPSVDTKNMVFKRKEEVTNDAPVTGQVAETDAKAKAVKRKSTVRLFCICNDVR